MSTRSLLFSAVLLLTVALVVMFAWQAGETARLRAEAVRLHAAHADLGALRAAHERLVSRRVSEPELARLRHADTEARQLRAEAAELRSRIAAGRGKAVARPAKAPAAPATTWTNAGRTTPAAAIESVLWSSAQGDVETLASLLIFDADTQARIEEVFASLPAEKRNRYGSPVEVFATLVAARMPGDLAQTEVLETTPGAGETAVRLRLRRTDGKVREAAFRCKPDADGWRLVVPARVANEHLRMLTGRSVAR